MSETVTDESRLLRVLLVCPDQQLYQEFKSAIRDVASLQIGGEVLEYVDEGRIADFVGKLRADALVIDLATDARVAMAIVERCSDHLPQLSIAGIHRTNDPETILNCLRSGASEFLHSPFAQGDLSNAVERMLRRKVLERRTEPKRRGQILAFAPVKGGAGATTLASNIAYTLLKESGGQVLIVDGALRAGILAFLFKLRTQYTILDALGHSSRLDPPLWSSMVSTYQGLDVMAAPERPEPMFVEPHAVQEVFEYARTEYDHIIIDLSSVCDPLAMAALTCTDEIYTVCTAEMPSLYMMRGTIPMLEELGHPRDRIRVIVNRHNERKSLSTEDMEKIFRANVFRTFPDDPAAVEHAMREAATVAQNTELGRAIRKFVHGKVGAPEQQGSKGFGIGSLKVLLGG